MFAKTIAKIFALGPAATAVECGVISGIVLTAVVCLMMAFSDAVGAAYLSPLADVASAGR
jgi:Flp pilus assembly pilin Flp